MSESLGTILSVLPLKNLKADAPEGMRIARHISKGTNSKLSESMAVIMPALTTEQFAEYLSVPAIADWMAGKVEGLIDMAVRRKLETGSTFISAADWASPILIALAEGDSSESRISVKGIEAWFNASLAANLSAYFATRLNLGANPTPAEAAKVSAMVARYRELFTRLAAKKVKECGLTSEQVSNLEKALIRCNEEGAAMAERLADRLSRVKPEEELLGME